jgi:hypothetical protein
MEVAMVPPMYFRLNSDLYFTKRSDYSQARDDLVENVLSQQE